MSYDMKEETIALYCIAERGRLAADPRIAVEQVLNIVNGWCEAGTLGFWYRGLRDTHDYYAEAELG